MCIQFVPPPVPPPPPPGLPIDDGVWILVLIAVLYGIKMMKTQQEKNVLKKSSEIPEKSGVRSPF